MARVQIGKKQRVETVDHSEATKAIARKVVREIVKEGFNGADVLPDIWVIEKTIRNSIVQEQPNISPDISQDEINDLAETVLSSVKVKTDIADEKSKSVETYESQLNFPKELPTIKMGNISVVKFPEGGSDSERSIKVDGYRKVGKFYAKRPEPISLGKRIGRSVKERDILRKEQYINLRRLKMRRGLLKPTPTKSFQGTPLSVGRPRFRMPTPTNMGQGGRPVSPIFRGKPKVNLNDRNLSEAIKVKIEQIKNGVAREKVSPMAKPSPFQEKIRQEDERDRKFVKLFKQFNKTADVSPLPERFKNNNLL